MSGSLSDRRALVTGASRGIGRAIAVRFAAEGAALAIGGRDLESLEETATRCRDAGAAAVVVVPFDVAEEDACVKAVSRTRNALGSLDVLVNNAGIADSTKFTETTLAQWRHIMAVDVEAPFLLIREALAGMFTERRGAVISVASLAAKQGFPYVAAYSAAKHALLGLTRSLAAEYATTGITFNCICPYYVDTPMTEDTIGNIIRKTGRTTEQARERLLTPQRRLIQPDEIAAMAVFLASHAGRSITGQAIHIDGGQLQA